MNIYVLKVVNTELSDWQASAYKGDCIVRASDEDDARRVATNHFHRAAEQSSNGLVPTNPWSQGALVSCEPYSGAEYPATGNAGILFPDWYA